jgi:hypothetical protein
MLQLSLWNSCVHSGTSHSLPLWSPLFSMTTLASCVLNVYTPCVFLSKESTWFYYSMHQMWFLGSRALFHRFLSTWFFLSQMWEGILCFEVASIQRLTKTTSTFCPFWVSYFQSVVRFLPIRFILSKFAAPCNACPSSVPWSSTNTFLFYNHISVSCSTQVSGSVTSTFLLSHVWLT